MAWPMTPNQLREWCRSAPAELEGVAKGVLQIMADYDTTRERCRILLEYQAERERMMADQEIAWRTIDRYVQENARLRKLLSDRCPGP